MLTAEHLTRRFGDRLAVDDASLTLEPGRIFALLGPNGAGKTTTLRMLAGLIAPSSGTVAYDGEVVSARTSGRFRGRIGFLTEAPGLWDRLTVRQNLTVYAELQNVPDVRRAVDGTMRLFGIADRADQPTAVLSKGLKQRVALARTLVHAPRVVLLDEPTSGLDPESAREVRHLILSLREEGRAILLSTHNLNEVDRVADRVAVLRTQMVAVGSPAALRSQLFGARLRVALAQDAVAFSTAVAGPGVDAVRSEGRTLVATVDDPAARAPEVVRRLVAAGADIQSVVPDEPSLEDVYLRILGHDRGRVNLPS